MICVFGGFIVKSIDYLIIIKYTLFMEILDALKYLGLSEKEGQVYMALISLGSASVYSIAKTSGLKRPTVYVLVDELIKKGVVSQVPRSRKQLYQAKSPDELLAEAENRFELIKQKMPELKALVKGTDIKPKVYFYEGKIGLDQTMQYGLKRMQDKEITGFYATATPETLKQFDHFKDFNDSVQKNRITLRGIAPDDPQIKEFRETDETYGRLFKSIPKQDYSPTVSIEMGDTFVKIQDFDNLQSIIIENSNITKTLKQIFELVWKSTN